MPTYEYECTACAHAMEVEQRITESALQKCPKCGKKKLKRLVGTGNFILKGGGWYADLYSSPPKKADATPSKSEESSSGSSKDAGNSTSESKPAKASKAKSSKKGTKGRRHLAVTVVPSASA